MNNEGMFYLGDDLTADVFVFNKIAGNLDNVDDSAIEAQIKLIKEEAKELVDAFENNEGKAQLLKETTDLYVVLMGLVYKLEAQGYDWELAQNKVNMNNIDKFVAGDDPETLANTLEMYKEQGVVVRPVYNEEYDMFVIVDENGKVRKPAGYQKCDVSMYVPKD